MTTNQDGWKPRVERDPVTREGLALFKCHMTNEPDDASLNGQWILKTIQARK